MKRISLILGCTLLLWSCGNNNADHEGNMADTTIAPADTMPQDGMINNTPADTTMGQAPADNNNGASNNTGGGANMNSNNANGNAGNSGGNAGSSSKGAVSGGATTSPKSGLAKTGQYNSDVATPEPLNLDDKRFRKTKPAHTYGDTAPRSRP